MRRVLTAATGVVLATAAVAGAAPSRAFTFTDPAGDANFTGGLTTTASQPAFDVVRVTLTPYARSKRTSGITVRLDLAAPPSTAPGTTYYVTATQGDCDFRVNLSLGAEGWDGMYSRSCVGSPVSGSVSSGSTVVSVPGGSRSVTVIVPEQALPDSRLGAKITDIFAGSAIADVVLHHPVAHPDVASHAGPYVVGR